MLYAEEGTVQHTVYLRLKQAQPTFSPEQEDAVEVAKEAARGAYICGIDITVYLPRDNARVGDHLLSQKVRLSSQLLEGCGAIEQPRLLL